MRKELSGRGIVQRTRDRKEGGCAQRSPSEVCVLWACFCTNCSSPCIDESSNVSMLVSGQPGSNVKHGYRCDDITSLTTT